MQIYLLRHGIAEAGGAGMSDADRALTPEGQQSVRDVARVAAATGVSPALVLSSPYKRAIATARIAAEELGYTQEPVTSNALRPDASPRAAWDEIQIHKDRESMLLVGHEPLFSALSAYLLGATEVRIDFRKGALLCLEIAHFGSQPRGVLKWFLTAKLAEACVQV